MRYRQANWLLALGLYDELDRLFAEHAGELPGLYTEDKARRFARAALIPEGLLERGDLETIPAAAALQIPERELDAALTDANA